MLRNSSKAAGLKQTSGGWEKHLIKIIIKNGGIDMSIYCVIDKKMTEDGNTLFKICDLFSENGPVIVNKDQLKEMIKNGDHVSGYKLDTIGRLIKNVETKQDKEAKDASEKLVDYLNNLKGTLALRSAPHKILCKRTPNQTSPACQA